MMERLRLRRQRGRILGRRRRATNMQEESTGIAAGTELVRRMLREEAEGSIQQVDTALQEITRLV